MSAKSTSCEERGLAVASMLRRSCDEVRRPLWAVKSAAEVLARSPRLSPHEQDVVSLIARNASRVDATIRCLLDQVAGSAGSGIPLGRERCSIAALCDEAIAIARSDLPGRSFRCSSVSEFAEWDRYRIVQLLTGLLAHADEYGAQGAGIHLACRITGEVASFAVTVAPAIRGADVLGLRLGIARDIARAHRGDLEVLHDASGRLSICARLPRGA